ncbi:MAG: TolC family protein [Deltaproteobacteria bacterium]|nr:MAG: TolC family protein [Deltaproteobacteria bacterium]
MRRFVWMLPLVMMMGCYKVPQVKVPLRLPGAFSNSGSSVLPTKWWTSLQEPRLNQMVEAALAGNFDLKAAWARLKQRKALARRSKSGLYPSINYRGETSGGVNEQGLLASAQFGLAASYEVDLWGRIRSGYKASTLEMQASRETLKASAISLSAEVATVWYQWAERRGQLQLLQSQKTVNTKTLELIETRFKLGQANAADVLQQRQLVEALDGEREQVLAQEKVLRHQLAVLLGKPPRSPLPEPPAQWKALPALPSAGVPAVLVNRRPDVQSAFLQVKAAHHRIAVAVADQFPQLNLSLDGSTAARTFGNFLGNFVATLAAGLLGPIYDGGRRAAEVRRTKAVAQEALQLYGRAVLGALREVEDALAREKHQRRLLASQKKQIKLANWVIERTRHNYLNGAENFLRVLDAIRSQQALQRAHLTARRDLVLIRIGLCRALAGGWKLKQPSLDPPSTSSTAKAKREKP